MAQISAIDVPQRVLDMVRAHLDWTPEPASAIEEQIAALEAQLAQRREELAKVLRRDRDLRQFLDLAETAKRSQDASAEGRH